MDPGRTPHRAALEAKPSEGDRRRRGRRRPRRASSACGGSADASPTITKLPLPRQGRSGAVAGLQGQPADRERAQAGAERDAQGLQLDRLHEPGLHQQLPEEVQLQGRVDELQHDHRRDLEDQERRGRLRRVRPDSGQPRSAGRDQADPAAQPQLHPEHRAGLARLQEPLLRPRLAVHGALHRLHDRHRLAEGPRRRQPGQLEERLPVPLAEEVRRQGGHPRRLS